MAGRPKSIKPFAKRSLGQNFLIDRNVVRKINGALGDVSESLVIEIGPGRGALTEFLAEKACCYAAIELDRVFAATLTTRYSEKQNVRIFEKDVLDTDLQEVVSGFKGFSGIKIIANLPYNISTAVLEKLAGAEIEFESAILMFQKEVVQRITAEPGFKDRGFLSVITRSAFETEFLFDVSPKSFRPVPRVNSAVVRLTPRAREEITTTEEFRRVVSVGFSQKRKTLANNLKNLNEVEDARGLLQEVGLDPSIRGERVSLEKWIEITKRIYSDTAEPDLLPVDS